jgi:D-serine dehydratase
VTGGVGDPFAESVLDWTLKGLPAAVEGAKAIAPIQNLRLDNDRMLFPIATLSRSAIAHNRAWMSRFLCLSGAKIAPHGKTTMAPDLFAMQMEDGAWAMTAATMHHVRAYRQFGVRRVLLANQVVGAAAADWVLCALEADWTFEFFCLVDSADNAEFLAARHAAIGAKRPLNVLIEIGRTDGRTGVRELSGARALAERVLSLSPHLALRGVETFEGVVQAAEDGATKAAAMVQDVASFAHEAAERDWFAPGPVILTAGGSGFFDLATRLLDPTVLRREAELVIRSGCYLTHDHGLYARLAKDYMARNPSFAGLGEGLRPALYVWAHVQSTPQPGCVICAFGKRDVGADVDPPAPVWMIPAGDNSLAPAPRGLKVTALYDQHAVLSAPDDCNLKVGDLVGFGVSHPCTTFDRWRALFLLEDDLRITGLVRTYF